MEVVGQSEEAAGKQMLAINQSLHSIVERVQQVGGLWGGLSVDSLPIICPSTCLLHCSFAATKRKST